MRGTQFFDCEGEAGWCRGRGYRATGVTGFDLIRPLFHPFSGNHPAFIGILSVILFISSVLVCIFCHDLAFVK